MHNRVIIIPEILGLLERVADLETQVAALEYLVYEGDETNEPPASTVSFTVDVPNFKNMSKEEIAEFAQYVAQKASIELRSHSVEITESKKQPEFIRQLERIADALEKLGKQNHVRLSGVICEASEVPIPPHSCSMSLHG